MHVMTPLILLPVAAMLLANCATAPKSSLEREKLQQKTEIALQAAQEADPTLTPVLESARGYVVFPTVGKGAIGVGGAFGRGILYEQGKPTGYASLSQGTIGLQLGGQAYTEIIVFNQPQPLEKFKLGDLTFSSQATAVALQSGAGANAKFKDGVAVFTMDEGGFMFEAAIGGQKFNYEPFGPTLVTSD